jgi:hypothetical protein
VGRVEKAQDAARARSGSGGCRRGLGGGFHG